MCRQIGMSLAAGTTLQQAPNGEVHWIEVRTGWEGFFKRQKVRITDTQAVLGNPAVGASAPSCS